MKIVALLFIFLSYSVVKAMALEEINDTPAFTFPTFELPSLDFIDLSGGCGSFTDCIEYVGAVIYNFSLGIIFLILLIIELIVYVLELVALLVAIQFTGFDGAPQWVNTILTTPFLAAVGFIIFKLIRKGSSGD